MITSDEVLSGREQPASVLFVGGGVIALEFGHVYARAGTKVTINEYIDLAKAYSTPQSGQFVNGILDSVHLDLIKQDKIHKVSHRQKA